MKSEQEKIDDWMQRRTRTVYETVPFPDQDERDKRIAEWETLTNELTDLGYLEWDYDGIGPVRNPQTTHQEYAETIDEWTERIARLQKAVDEGAQLQLDVMGVLWRTHTMFGPEVWGMV